MTFPLQNTYYYYFYIIENEKWVSGRSSRVPKLPRTGRDPRLQTLGLLTPLFYTVMLEHEGNSFLLPADCQVYTQDIQVLLF